MYKVVFKKIAQKDLKKLDHSIRNEILDFVEIIAQNPFMMGKPLTGRLKGLWKYRVTDYRIIYEIQNELMIVMVVRVGHRKEIYEKLDR